MQKRMSKNDDLILHWHAFLAGDNNAFAILYETLTNDLFSFGITLTSDEELVKDCIQDVFLRVYQHRKPLPAGDNIKVYLMISLKNALVDTFRKQQNFQQYIETYGTDDPYEFYDESAEEQIIAQESEMAMHEKIALCKSALTKRQQEIIHYRFVEELTIDEIADILHINYQSVANTIQRSLKKMRNFFIENRV